MKRQLLIFLSLTITLSLFSQDPEEATPMLKKATEAMRAHRYTEAEDLYRFMIQQNPDDLTLHQLLSHALMNQKRFREADSMLYKIIEKDSNNAGSYWYLGLSAERQQLDSAAAANFKYYIFKTRNANSRNLKAWLHVGSAYRRMMHKQGINDKQYADMVKHYQLYLEKNPVDAYADELTRFLERVAERKPAPNTILIWTEEN